MFCSIKKLMKLDLNQEDIFLARAPFNYINIHSKRDNVNKTTTESQHFTLTTIQQFIRVLITLAVDHWPLYYFWMYDLQPHLNLCLTNKFICMFRSIFPATNFNFGKHVDYTIYLQGWVLRLNETTVKRPWCIKMLLVPSSETNKTMSCPRTWPLHRHNCLPIFPIGVSNEITRKKRIMTQLLGPFLWYFDNK